MQLKTNKIIWDDIWDVSNSPDTPYYKNDETRKQINELLLENAKIEASLGKDSTKKEWAIAKVKQDRIFEQIKNLDTEFYKIICP